MRIVLLYFVVSRRSQPARPTHSIVSSHNCVLLVLLSGHRSCLNPPVSAKPSASLASVYSLWSCSDHWFYCIQGPLAIKQRGLFLSCNGRHPPFSSRDARFLLFFSPVTSINHPLQGCSLLAVLLEAGQSACFNAQLGCCFKDVIPFYR